MANKYVIAIDLGTNSNKAAVVSLEGEIITKASKESKLFYPASGQVELKSEIIFDYCFALIEEVTTISKIDKD